jgi:hypothetical protein
MRYNKSRHVDDDDVLMMMSFICSCKKQKIGAKFHIYL